jgi:hypothetical protein
MENQTLADAVVTQMVMEQEASDNVEASALARSNAAAQTGASVEAQVREYFKDIPIMQEVAFCESTFRQFKADGSPLRGHENASDIGVMQINEYYHSSTAIKLGFDLATTEGNMAYARYLYDTQGTAPWIHSKPCWGGAVNQLALSE